MKETRYLVVPSCHYVKGEAWIREAYKVSSEVKIIESKPLPIHEPSANNSWMRG